MLEASLLKHLHGLPSFNLISIHGHGHQVHTTLSPSHSPFAPRRYESGRSYSQLPVAMGGIEHELCTADGACSKLARTVNRPDTRPPD
jgi:hypothetical protein